MDETASELSLLVEPLETDSGEGTPSDPFVFASSSFADETEVDPERGGEASPEKPVAAAKHASKGDQLLALAAEAQLGMN